MLNKKTNVHVVKRTYDDKGNIKRESYFDTNGQPILRNRRYSQVLYHYDAFNRFENAELTDLQGNIVSASKVMIVEVPPNSVGHTKGLREGDMMQAYDGIEIENSFVLLERSRVQGDQNRVLKIVSRDGMPKSIDVQPGDLGVTLENM